MMLVEKKCPECDGDRVLINYPHDSSNEGGYRYKCPFCEGTGVVYIIRDTAAERTG